MENYECIQTATEREFIRRSVERLKGAINDAITGNGRCILGLSGGSTPRPVYEALGRSHDVDWSKVTVFLVDERYVPADDDNSNQHLVRTTLLANAGVGTVVFPDTALAIGECIMDYEERLPHDIDVVVLGMGEDGHIASLFPRTSASHGSGRRGGDVVALSERERRVLRTLAPTTSPIRDRITVTLPVLACACSILFLLRGEGKKRMFEEMLSAEDDPAKYPAHALLVTGRTVWVTLW